MTATGMPVTGVVCRGQRVELGWPEPEEFDRLTALRNRPGVRERFLDSRLLDPVRNREWLATGMRRPFEGVLAIRCEATLAGMIGWSGWDPEARTVELGRVIVDPAAARRLRGCFPANYAGIALDAGTALRDLLFEALDVQCMRTVHLADNALAIRASATGGGIVVSRHDVRRADGARVEVVEMTLTREAWRCLRAQRAAA
jgi:RimJ/RimL family protein N-acetyltransferase